MKTTSINISQFIRSVAKAIFLLLLLEASSFGQTAMELDRQKVERLKTMAGTWVQTSTTTWSEYPTVIEVSDNGNLKCTFEGTAKSERALLKETKELGTYWFEYKRMNKWYVTMKIDGTFQVFSRKDNEAPQPGKKPVASGKKQ